MKVTDLRCGREFIGEHVTTIPGGSSPTDEALGMYLGISPQDKQYPYHKRPTAHKRVVLRHAPDKFFVIPVDKRFYKVET